MKKLLLFAVTFTSAVFLTGCDSATNNSVTLFTVTLSPSPTDGGNVSAAEQAYDEGSIATIAAAPADEWVFVRWEGDFSGTSSTATFTVDADKNITAVFAKKNYALTVNTSGEGTVDEQVVQNKATDYESGTVVELTANPAVGWEFKEWTGAIADTTNPVEITIDDPKQITAIFMESPAPQYTVTLNPSPAEGGSVSAASQVYDEGSIATIAATPASEWEFIRWEGDFSGTSSTSTLTVDTDKNITAVFEKKDYALTVNTSGDGTVDEQIVQAKTTNYESGTVVELTAIPGDGWGFVRWEGAITGNTNPVQITVDNPAQVTAVFESFYLASNGVTVKCGAAEFGQQGFVNGILYTKRTKAQITVSNASTTCTSGITNMSSMFQGLTFFTEDISSWDVSMVTDMGSMFEGITGFSIDLSNWDVSSVTNMNSMFFGAASFNEDLSSWEVSSVTSMSSMFEDAADFNGDLSSWEVSSVIDMNSMFRNATSFNGDISAWDVSSVTGMNSMFFNASSFNGDLSSWDVSSVTDMNSMFVNATSFNGNLSNWDVSSVTDMFRMFRNVDSFNEDLSNWNVSSVTNMNGMFLNATSFNGNISTWDVSSVTNMNGMFLNATSFNGNISTWDVSSVTIMGSMFSGADSFNGNISTWDVSSVTIMGSMFSGATSFNGDISTWDVSSVTDLAAMFVGATSFNGDLSSWDVSSVTDMTSMFIEATSFNGNISAWDVSSVTEMNYMFSNASSFNQDLSGWCVTNIPSEPIDFSAGSPLINDNKPVWGTCPGM